MVRAVGMFGVRVLSFLLSPPGSIPPPNTFSHRLLQGKSGTEERGENRAKEKGRNEVVGCDGMDIPLQQIPESGGPNKMNDPRQYGKKERENGVVLTRNFHHLDRGGVLVIELERSAHPNVCSYVPRSGFSETTGG